MQFCYDKKDNIKVLENALNKKYEIYFAKENIVLKNINDLKKKGKSYFIIKKLIRKLLI